MHRRHRRPRGSRGPPSPCGRRARRRGSRAPSGSGGSTSRSRGAARRRGSRTSPRPSCCRRHASSSSTTRYGSSVSKSAGGSLKARWPFSPMPTKATSIGSLGEERAHAPALGGRIRGVAGQEVERPRVDPLDDPLAQVAAEARGVRVGDADVLVEVEQLDPRPVDARRRGERVQELELRRAGGGDHARLPGPGDRLADRRRRALRRRAPELLLGVEDLDLHFGFLRPLRRSRVAIVSAAARRYPGPAAQRRARPPAPSATPSP